MNPEPASALGPELAQLIRGMAKSATEEGVRLGLGMAALILDETAIQLGDGPQVNALRECAAEIRTTSAEFTLQ